MASIFGAFKKTTVGLLDAVTDGANAITKVVSAGNIAAADLANYVEHTSVSNQARRELTGVKDMIADITRHESEIAMSLVKTAETLSANPAALAIYNKIATPEDEIKAKYAAILEARKRS